MNNQLNQSGQLSNSQDGCQSNSWKYDSFTTRPVRSAIPSNSSLTNMCLPITDDGCILVVWHHHGVNSLLCWICQTSGCGYTYCKQVSCLIVTDGPTYSACVSTMKTSISHAQVCGTMSRKSDSLWQYMYCIVRRCDIGQCKASSIAYSLFGKGQVDLQRGPGQSPENDVAP